MRLLQPPLGDRHLYLCTLSNAAERLGKQAVPFKLQIMQLLGKMQCAIPKGKASSSNGFSKPKISRQIGQDCGAPPKCEAHPQFAANPQRKEGAPHDLVAQSRCSDVRAPLQH